MWLKSLPNGGTMTRVAWGMTMRQAQRFRSLDLPARHRLHTVAHDLGHVGAFVDGQPDHGGLEGGGQLQAEHVDIGEAEQARRGHAREQHHQQHQHRDAPDEPDIERTGRPDHGEA
jgi:hypothetical protein